MPSETIGAGQDWQQWKKDYDSEIAKLTVAAKKEGKVVVYAGTEPRPFMDEVDKYFKETYGINVEFLTLRTPEILGRIRAEAAAGKIKGDIHMSGSPVTRGIAKQGHYTYYVPPAAKEPGVKWYMDPIMDKDKFGSDGFPICMFPDPHGTVINRKFLPADKVPKTFEDFFDPFFKGKVLFNDPRVPGGGNIYHLYMYKLYGENYLRKLKDYVVLERRYPIGIRSIASGEYLMYLGVAARMCKGMEETGIDVIYPEAHIISIAQMAILNGPHPAAAKLYLNFSLTKLGQEMATKFANRVPVRADVTGVAKIVDIKGMKILVPSFHEDMVEKGERRNEAKAVWPK